MPVKATKKTILTTAVLLATGEVLPVSVLVGAGSASDVFLGGADVTTATGYPLSSGTYSVILPTTGDALYGISTSGTTTVNVIQTRF